ncbi:MAG: hypothetical protein HYX53_01185 [Chloroflexi bacterium]|nr:hypothetical protein [Chloroflexota bacterium]
MDTETRRFTAWLALFAGLVLLFGGYAFMFTIEGAEMVWAGLGALVAGVLLFTRCPWPLAFAAGVAALAAGVAYTAFVYPGG